jgi:two-component system sensor histidine kinase DegS
MMLDDLGLLPTIKKYGESIKDQTGIEVTIVATGTERRLESYLEVMIFRALQELVGNAIRHGQGTNIKVQVNVEEAYVRVAVDDNGKCFSLITLDTSPGLGLKFIRERVELLGGTMDIDSTVGQGARINFQIPYAKT